MEILEIVFLERGGASGENGQLSCCWRVEIMKEEE